MSELIGLLIAVASAVSFHAIELQEPAPDAPQTLQDGEYVISITSPDVPKDQRTVSHKIQLNVDAKTGKVKGKLLRTLDGRNVDPLPVHGVVKGKTLKFAISDIEDGALLTFHFSGELTDAENARGSFIAFRDVEKLTTGAWNVTKSKK